jgi:hypothetical protein
MSFAAAAPALLLSGLTLFSCTAPQERRPQREFDQVELADAELATKLADFSDYVAKRIESAAAEIERRSSTREHRRAVARWYKHLTEKCRAFAHQPRALDGLLDVWTLSRRQVAFFTDGAGRSLFGPHQSFARDAAIEINTGIEELARQHLKPEGFDDARAYVVTYARENPMTADFSGLPPKRLSDDTQIQRDMMDALALPFAPLAALRGVGDAPDSVRDVSRSVDRFTDTVEQLPASARWELQLLMMNLEETQTLRGLSANMTRVAEDATRLTNTAEEFVQVADRMPAQIRSEAELLLDRLDASHPELRSTLDDARQTVEVIRATNSEITATISEVDQTLSGVGEAAQALEHAADSVTITIQAIRELVRREPNGEGSGSTGDAQAASPAAGRGSDEASSGAPAAEQERFSFQAVTASAEALGETTSRLQGLLADLRGFLDDGSVSRESTAVSSALNGVVDRAVIRAGQLLLVAFVLMLCYALIRSRWLRDPRQAAGA